MEIVGNIEFSLPLGRKNGLISTDIVIRTNGRNTQYIKIRFSGSINDDLAGLRINDYVRVHVSVGGVKFINKQGEMDYYNTISAYKIEKL